MEITDFTLGVYFIPKTTHRSACTIGYEYLNNILLSFAYDFILIGMGPDNAFPNSERLNNKRFRIRFWFQLYQMCHSL